MSDYFFKLVEQIDGLRKRVIIFFIVVAIILSGPENITTIVLEMSKIRILNHLVSGEVMYIYFYFLFLLTIFVLIKPVVMLKETASYIEMLNKRIPLNEFEVNYEIKENTKKVSENLNSFLDVLILFFTQALIFIVILYSGFVIQNLMLLLSLISAALFLFYMIYFIMITVMSFSAEKSILRRK